MDYSGRPVASGAAEAARGDERRGEALLGIGIAMLALFAVIKLVPALDRLVFQDVSQLGAVDLRLRWNETKAWFAGHPARGLVYPGASFVMFWPLMGWLSLALTRVLWVPLYLVSLVWLGRVCARESAAETSRGRIAAALLPAALTSSAVTIAVGQLGLFTLAAGIAFALALARGRRTPLDDLRAAALFVVCAMKPTIAAPFSWLLVALPRRLAPGAIASAIYLGLTLLAMGGRDNLLIPDELVWFGANDAPLQASQGYFLQGYANLQNLSANAGFTAAQSFVLPVLALIACGAWVWRHRHSDVWILLGVCGLVGRLSFYHRLYDDLLALPAIIALARIAASRARASATGADDAIAVAARALLLVGVVAVCLPGRILVLLAPLPHVFNALTWLVTLCFLDRLAESPDSMDLGLEPHANPAR